MCRHCRTESNGFNPSEIPVASPVLLAPIRTGLVPIFDDVSFDATLKIKCTGKPGSHRVGRSSLEHLPVFRMSDQDILVVEHNQVSAFPKLHRRRRPAVAIELEVEPDNPSRRAIDRRTEGDHGDIQVERKIGRRSDQLVSLASVDIPAALTCIVATRRNFDLSNLVAGFVLERAASRQFPAIEPSGRGDRKHRLGRSAHAISLASFEPIQPLNLQPMPVTVADIDAVQRRPLREIALYQTRRRTGVAGIGRLHDGRTERESPGHTREHFDLKLQVRNRASACLIHGGGRGIFRCAIEGPELDEDQQRGQKADHPHDARG